MVAKVKKSKLEKLKETNPNLDIDKIKKMAEMMCGTWLLSCDAYQVERKANQK